MSWARLDDRFHENRKVRRAWRAQPASIGLHVMAITYCAGNETDGFVDLEFVAEKLPRDRGAVQALVDAGLWEQVDGGWQINDFLDYNPSRAEQDAKREHLSRVRADAGRRGGLAKAAKGQQAPSKLPASNAASSSPDPTRTQEPPQPPASGGRRRDVDRFEWEVTAFAANLLGRAPTADEAKVIAGAVRRGARTRDAVVAEVRQWRPDVFPAIRPVA